uniref:L-type lectin-domain containing receptor kinase IX.1-like n=1 Tax=Erigeron canadensis TaxID=72917 RepID=UPI001CB8F62A|nr:L-type lectin-domain containing receptor kinase IX.1-like [Erigeron canadensis]
MEILTCFFLALIIRYAASITFDFPDINQTLQGVFTLENGAYVSDIGIQVTPENKRSDPNKFAGRVTYYQHLHLWDKTSREQASFDTEFSFIIKANNATFYADGLTFFLAENSTLITGGEALGLPVSNSMTYPFVAVEFDTFGSNDKDPKDIDIFGKHVGIDVNSLVSVDYEQWKYDVSTGEECKVYVKYDSVSTNINVLVYNDTGVGVELNHIIDLRDVLPERVIFGFSAATGDLFEKHTLKSWKFNSSKLHVDEAEVKPPTTSPNNSTLTSLSKNSDQNGKNKTRRLMVGIIVGVLVVTFSAIIAFFLCWRKKKKRVQEPAEGVQMNKDFELGTGARKFSYQELVKATAGFVEKNKLGEGGFGGVYKGFLKDRGTYIAVKRVSKTSEQGIKEYESEVKIISQLRHRNLVHLNGWCHEKGELLLVYEFMENGSLDLHLFEGKSLLSWVTRYKIAHGLASALLYLHNEWEQCVLHRDIKSSNVMLDSCFNAKLGDFGLARLVDHEKGSQTTKMAGTMGYMAPEYVMTGKASKEADVFSFGVVALEIACGRKPLYLDGSKTKTELVEWVWDLYGTETLLEAVDPCLGSDFAEEEIKRLMVVGLWCVHPDPIARPSMRQAIQVLKFEASPPILPLKMPKPTYNVPSTSTSNGNTSSGCNTVSSNITSS